jgi:hypothetical protein
MIVKKTGYPVAFCDGDLRQLVFDELAVVSPQWTLILSISDQHGIPSIRVPVSTSPAATEVMMVRSSTTSFSPPYRQVCHLA